MLDEFSIKLPGETVPVAFDFTDVLPTGATLTGSPVVSATALGLVAGSTALTISSATVTSDGKGVTCRVAGGTAKENYRLEALCDDTAGNRPGVQGIMQVRNMGE